MSRSLKKGPFTNPKLIKKVAKYKAEGLNGVIKTWYRSSTITPEMVGIKFAIHTGKDFVEITITESMVGHKLGEFAPTRKFSGHSSKKNK